MPEYLHCFYVTKLRNKFKMKIINLMNIIPSLIKIRIESYFNYLIVKVIIILIDLVHTVESCSNKNQV